MKTSQGYIIPNHILKEIKRINRNLTNQQKKHSKVGSGYKVDLIDTNVSDGYELRRNINYSKDALESSKKEQFVLLSDGNYIDRRIVNKVVNAQNRRNNHLEKKFRENKDLKDFSVSNSMEDLTVLDGIMMRLSYVPDKDLDNAILKEFSEDYVVNPFTTFTEGYTKEGIERRLKHTIEEHALTKKERDTFKNIEFDGLRFGAVGFKKKDDVFFNNVMSQMFSNKHLIVNAKDEKLFNHLIEYLDKRTSSLDMFFLFKRALGNDDYFVFVYDFTNFMDSIIKIVEAAGIMPKWYY